MISARPQHRPRRSAKAPALLAALAVLVLVGMAISTCAAPHREPAPAPPAVAPVAPAPGPTIAPPIPVAISIPRIGVASTLIQTGILPDGTAEVPPVDTPEQASWLSESPRPGEPGPAVIYGHIDGAGQRGVFADLDQLAAGDRVLIGRGSAPPAEFEVYAVESYPKTEFPAAKVYGDTEGPELRLVTCTGPFDRAAGHHRDNLVVYARLTPAGAATTA